MKAKSVVNFLIPKLIDKNFIVHQYKSKTTSSIYLKLDYGVCCGIRIADHPGKKKYHYRFNVIKDYKGDKAIKNGSLISYFFDFTELEDVIKAVEQEREKKINAYGLENYKTYIEKDSKNQLFERFKNMKGEFENGRIRKIRSRNIKIK